MPTALWVGRPGAPPIPAQRARPGGGTQPGRTGAVCGGGCLSASRRRGEGGATDMGPVWEGETVCEKVSEVTLC
jgi:hypothetical protein